MACFKRPIISSLMGRSYATQAAQKLVNQADSPLARMSIAYNAGSKYETQANTGITHAARVAMCAGNPDYITIVELPKLVQQLGGSFTCTSTREHMIFTFEGQKETVQHAQAALISAALPANFKDKNNFAYFEPHINLELSRLEHAPQIQALELLHKAAFGRGGMGNSLYMPRYSVGSHNMEMINQFMAEFYSPANATVITTGLDANETTGLWDNFVKLNSNSTGSTFSLASKYVGGEAYQGALGNEGTFALAFEGASIGGSDGAALTVLKHLIGNTDASIKYADGKSASLIGKNSPVNLESMCFNYSYSDCGLFGVVVSASGNELGKAVDSTIASLASVKNGGITEEDLSRSKIKCAVENANSYEDVHSVCLSRMSADALSTLETEAKAAQSVTLQQVQAVAKKLLSSPASLAAVGNLTQMPYLKDIKL